jgi:hypothetical protein
MIQWGSRNGCADLRKLIQSVRPRGENSLVPIGQLPLSLERRIAEHSVHLTSPPGENGPFIVIFSHLHDLGLPGAGSVFIGVTPLHGLASTFPFATAGSIANSAFLYCGV